MPGSTEDIELNLFLEAINSRYGYDFRSYARASLLRRVRALVAKTRKETISKLQHELLHSQEFFASILPELTITTSEMFRDPAFFRAFREQVVPVLRTYSTFKVWHAGCSTGEEVYSLAILLEEEGLLDHAVTYATDINQVALQTAREAIYPASQLRQFEANYEAAGGRGGFSRYLAAAYDSLRFDARLRRNTVFAAHNLVTDAVFSEVHVILSRNVMIYFDRELQGKVLDLFTRSLRYKGFLCLGSKETIRFMRGGDRYDEVPGGQRIFRKMVATPDDAGGLLP